MEGKSRRSCGWSNLGNEGQKWGGKEGTVKYEKRETKCCENGTRNCSSSYTFPLCFRGTWLGILRLADKSRKPFIKNRRKEKEGSCQTTRVKVREGQWSQWMWKFFDQTLGCWFPWGSDQWAWLLGDKGFSAIQDNVVSVGAQLRRFFYIYRIVIDFGLELRRRIINSRPKPMTNFKVKYMGNSISGRPWLLRTWTDDVTLIIAETLVTWMSSSAIKNMWKERSKTEGRCNRNTNANLDWLNETSAKKTELKPDKGKKRKRTKEK